MEIHLALPLFMVITDLRCPFLGGVTLATDPRGFRLTSIFQIQNNCEREMSGPRTNLLAKINPSSRTLWHLWNNVPQKLDRLIRVFVSGAPFPVSDARPLTSIHHLRAITITTSAGIAYPLSVFHFSRLSFVFLRISFRTVSSSSLRECPKGVPLRYSSK
jgi:hypothetical protein